MQSEHGVMFVILVPKPVETSTAERKDSGTEAGGREPDSHSVSQDVFVRVSIGLLAESRNHDMWVGQMAVLEAGEWLTTADKADVGLLALFHSASPVEPGQGGWEETTSSEKRRSV